MAGMDATTLLQDKLHLLTRRVISENFAGRRGGDREAPAQGEAVKDALATHSAFLLDPRGAFGVMAAPIYRLTADFKMKLLAAAGASGRLDLTEAAEVCDLLLRISRINGITAESIEADRRQQRLDLDWPYNEAVPDGQPQPAEEQRSSYQGAGKDLAREMGEGGRLSGIAAHPSVQFLAGWLAYKSGSQFEQSVAVCNFTAAAAHPLLRTSCALLRGLALFYLQHPAAQRELEAGLQLDAQADAGCCAQPSLVVDAHSALALIHARRGGIHSANLAGARADAAAAQGGREAHTASRVAGDDAEEGGELEEAAAAPGAEESEAAATALTLTLASYEQASRLAEQHPAAMMSGLLRKVTAALAPHLPDGRLVGLYRLAMQSWDRHGPSLQRSLQYHRQRAERRMSGTAAEGVLGPYDSVSIVLQAEPTFRDWGWEPDVQLDDLPAAASYCQRCGTRAGSLKRCARCRRFCYCQQSCQASDWPTHKMVCRSS